MIFGITIPLADSCLVDLAMAINDTWRLPFACPAQGSFGPWTVGLAVGVLVVVLGDWVLENDVAGLGHGSRLNNDRNAQRYTFG